LCEKIFDSIKKKKKKKQKRKSFAMKVQNRNPVKNQVTEEKGRKSAEEKVFNTTLLVDGGRLLESEPSSPVSLSPLPLLATAATTTMGQFFWSSQPTHSHLIFSEGIIA
jgi:hypothetical protein